MSWSGDVVDELCLLKRAGVPFDAAWGIAIRAHRPGGRDVGWCGETLFEQADTESPVDFLRRVCADAWFGRRPALGKLAVLLEDGAVFPVPERPAFRSTAASGRSRTAA